MFKDEVKEIIESSGLTMEKFSQKTKIKKRTLENWKAGKCEPDEFTKEAFREKAENLKIIKGYSLYIIQDEIVPTYAKIKIRETNIIKNWDNIIIIEKTETNNYNEAIKYFEKKYNLKFNEGTREFE